MKRTMAALLSLLGACGDGSEADAEKAHATAAAGWAILLGYFLLAGRARATR